MTNPSDWEDTAVDPAPITTGDWVHVLAQVQTARPDADGGYQVCLRDPHGHVYDVPVSAGSVVAKVEPPEPPLPPEPEPACLLRDRLGSVYVRGSRQDWARVSAGGPTFTWQELYRTFGPIRVYPRGEDL